MESVKLDHRIDATRSKLSVFGLGYVGCVSAACLASRGHSVVGLDVDPRKLRCLSRGEAPVVERRIADITAEAVASGRLTVSDDPVRAVCETDMSIVCVGTPSGAGGGLSTEYLERVTDIIGSGLAAKDSWHVVVYRSTMVPGTCESLLVPRLEAASGGKRAGIDFGVCVNPEFLREGSSVEDFFDPPKTVVGESDPRSGMQVMALYEDFGGSRFRVRPAVAEMVKYVDNSFHALKVDFGNEIGAICGALGLDSHAVMEIFVSDTKLNISPAYLMPGFAFGGSCLPKDVRALVHTARRHDVEVPVLSNVLTSNEVHLRRVVDLVLSLDRHRIGLFGLSFKQGTDDLRESPMVELAERLIGKGFDLKIYDADVALSRLTGSNQAFLDHRLPHIGSALTDDPDEVLSHGEVLIAGSRDERAVAALDRAGADHVIVDLVRLPHAEDRRRRGGYVGTGW
ncbi:nucleotide sugar dehydrogenase [Rhodococcus ruber]|uniref:UDP-glucose 6-dehydrogenase n=2 Tax=Rhodococcus ruber TaxID=1830 RepID=A0A098BSX5_9NOCA|nr:MULTISPECIES: nucleotide sugar dehydrogenase [Rhodococcus]AXY51054.1 GDP-mannose 6-dehydrogenase [Rhodococcus ruber]MCD2126846.1 nucleotide sugar dehydrogenase [Rhodococcus ruber]MCZ1070754.1 nucleotide sugar dehydrogenase [Rhodococcus sp. A5(2022)]MCZ4503725.1 nucleotide sugar dehydrogenase [Rhodococcus ruber]MCZ4619268.1 nucleotide sugar dehydrogenase [Rhodococcus ruber]